MVTVRRIFLDTNFWIRYFVRDEEKQYQASCKLAKDIVEGRYLPFTSAIVFLEINFVLSNFYKQTPEQINHFFDLILELRNITIINKTNLEQAILWHKDIKIKLADCLIASSVPKNCHLITWDKDFNRIKTIKKITPDQLS